MRARVKVGVRVRVRVPVRVRARVQTTGWIDNYHGRCWQLFTVAVPVASAVVVSVAIVVSVVAASSPAIGCRDNRRRVSFGGVRRHHGDLIGVAVFGVTVEANVAFAYVAKPARLLHIRGFGIATVTFPIGVWISVLRYHHAMPSVAAWPLRCYYK